MIGVDQEPEGLWQIGSLHHVLPSLQPVVPLIRVDVGHHVGPVLVDLINGTPH
jgi:hypothetical protein